MSSVAKRLKVFFMDKFPESPLIIPLGPFRIFSKIRGDIRSSRFATSVNEKIFNQKNYNNFFGTPLDSRVYIYINFCLQGHFKVSAAWYCSHCLPSVSLIPPPVLLTTAAICHRYRWHRWQICHRYQQHKWNWWQICHRCRWYRRCTFICEYLCKLGLGGNWFMIKPRSEKSRNTVPLKSKFQ